MPSKGGGLRPVRGSQVLNAVFIADAVAVSVLVMFVKQTFSGDKYNLYSLDGSQ